MRVALSLAAVMCVCAFATADYITTYASVPYTAPAQDIAYDIATYEGENHQVFDLVVEADAGERWLCAGVHAYFQGANDTFRFWDHPNGGNVPDATNFPYFGLAAYDSFWTCPEEYPNPDLVPSSQTTFFLPGSPLQNTDTHREAEWSIDPEPPHGFGGPYTIARYNLTGDFLYPFVPYETPYGVGCSLIIEGDNYFDGTGGTPHPFHLEIPLCWYIPEPAGLALLALGGMMVIRRR